jgi:DNA repair protein RadD
MTTKTLRPYQSEAIEAIYAYFGEKEGNPLVVLPTGTGKSLVIAEFCARTLSSWPDTKILVVTHVRELIRQNLEEMLTLWPAAPAGVNSAGLGRRDTRQPIVFCSIQTVHSKAHLFDKVDLVLVDEAHLIPRTSSTMYRKFFDALRVGNPHVKVIGLTATPYRLDSGLLNEGDEALFDDVAYEAKLLDMIDQGYLSPLISKATATRLDVTGVGRRGGEFIAGQLQDAVDIEATNRAAVAEIIRLGADRRSWLIFGSGIRHCGHLADIVRESGISCETIFGDTPKDERDSIVRRFKAGEIRCLVSMSVLTTGFNAPSVDLIAMLRPTESTSLYCQIMGRGMRLSPGKKNCVVLDFAGNVLRHGPVDAVEPKKPGKGDGGEAPVKECPECHTYVHAALRECPECGHSFPAPEPKITAASADAPVLSTETTPAEWVPVRAVTYALHQKAGKPCSLLVEYVCGLSIHREWVCLEHEGYAKTKALGWWMKHDRNFPGRRPPASVAEALVRRADLLAPTEIKVRRAGKYIEIVDHRVVRNLSPGGPGVRVLSPA